MSASGMKIMALTLALMPPAVFAEQERFPLPPKEWPEPIDDHPVIPFFLLDRLEYRWNDAGADARVWDAQGWIGGDWNRFWFKTEGTDLASGGTEEAEVQALYARLIAPFWYLQAGLRHDAEPEPTLTFAVLGAQGLAPYWFDVEATAFVSDDGDVSARVEAEYELLFTQRLILQPRLETNFAASEVEEVGVGQGINDLQLGLRLHYEIKREFAPYIGITWTRKVGETADLAKREGKEREDTAVIAGVRLWY